MSPQPCRRCGEREGHVTPYWATDGHQLCATCCAAVAALLDEHDKWPEVPWTDTDEEVLS